MRWKIVPPLALVGTMLAAAWLILRPPDPGQVLMFFAAGVPSLAAGEAVMTLLAWLVVLVAAYAAIWSVVREFRRSPAVGRATSNASLFLVVGLLLLAVGAIRHTLPSASMCCATGSVSIREAEDLAR
jgi:hypothetical protein